VRAREGNHVACSGNTKHLRLVRSCMLPCTALHPCKFMLLIPRYANTTHSSSPNTFAIHYVATSGASCGHQAANIQYILCSFQSPKHGVVLVSKRTRFLKKVLLGVTRKIRITSQTGAGPVLMHGYSVEYPKECKKIIHTVYNIYMYQK
jgi:hypothetical protein